MQAPVGEVAKRGVITIPKAIRDKHGIGEGSRYTFHDLGQGAILLSPRSSRIDALCDDLRETALSRGATLEDMLEELRQARDGEAV